MNWLDNLLDRGMEAKRAADPVAGPPAIAKPREPEPEIKTVCPQTRAPQRAGDPGECTIGYYSVSDGVVTMRDESGKATGKEYRLAPGDNERIIASRLTVEAWRKITPDFNRPLRYQTPGVA
jgi:hypothetical protein